MGTSKGGGKQWQPTPKKLPRMQGGQSHTGRLTGLWFLPKLAFGLNTNDDNTITISRTKKKFQGLPAGFLLLHSFLSFIPNSGGNYDHSSPSPSLEF